MNIAIVGATGNVGRKLLEVIEKLNFKFSELYLIASDKSHGKKITFKNKSYSIVGLNDFDNSDNAYYCFVTNSRLMADRKLNLCFFYH